MVKSDDSDAKLSRSSPPYCYVSDCLAPGLRGLNFMFAWAEGKGS